MRHYEITRSSLGDECIADCTRPGRAAHYVCGYCYMAVDQYGQTEHNLGPYPRQELLRRNSATKAAKIYRDKRDGRAVHVGWIVRGFWYTVYKVEPMRRTGAGVCGLCAGFSTTKGPTPTCVGWKGERKWKR